MRKNKAQLAVKHKLARRKSRVKASLAAREQRLRLSVFRSLKYISVQIVDDEHGRTLLAVSDRELPPSEQKKTKVERAQAVGKLVAEKAKSKKISQVVFDRSGYRYHGRVKAVADGAREGGLIF